MKTFYILTTEVDTFLDKMYNKYYGASYQCTDLDNGYTRIKVTY